MRICFELYVPFILFKPDMIQPWLHIASSYFYLPIDEDSENDHRAPRRHISWPSPDSTDSEDSSFSSTSTSSSSSLHEEYNLPSSSTSATFPSAHATKSRAVIKEILAEDDLYKVLGISRSSPADRLTLRRAYLSRSKSCHPE